MKKLEEEHKEENKNTHIKNIGEKYFETIRKKTSLWQEYTYDGKQEAIKTEIKSTMKALDIPIKIQIPLKENIRYKREKAAIHILCMLLFSIKHPNKNVRLGRRKIYMSFYKVMLTVYYSANDNKYCKSRLKE